MRFHCASGPVVLRSCATERNIVHRCFCVSFVATVFATDIEGVQNEVMNWNILFSECSEHVKYDIYRESFRMGPNLKQPSAGLSNIRPAGQNRPVARLNPARRMIS